jgi:hypothetical protein
MISSKISKLDSTLISCLLTAVFSLVFLVVSELDSILTIVFSCVLCSFHLWLLCRITKRRKSNCTISRIFKICSVFCLITGSVFAIPFFFGTSTKDPHSIKNTHKETRDSEDKTRDKKEGKSASSPGGVHPRLVATRKLDPEITLKVDSGRQTSRPSITFDGKITLDDESIDQKDFECKVIKIDNGSILYPQIAKVDNGIFMNSTSFRGEFNCITDFDHEVPFGWYKLEVGITSVAWCGKSTVEYCNYYYLETFDGDERDILRSDDYGQWIVEKNRLQGMRTPQNSKGATAVFRQEFSSFDSFQVEGRFTLCRAYLTNEREKEQKIALSISFNDIYEIIIGDKGLKTVSIKGLPSAAEKSNDPETGTSPYDIVCLDVSHEFTIIKKNFSEYVKITVLVDGEFVYERRLGIIKRKSAWYLHVRAWDAPVLIEEISIIPDPDCF